MTDFPICLPRNAEERRLLWKLPNLSPTNHSKGNCHVLHQTNIIDLQPDKLNCSSVGIRKMSKQVVAARRTLTAKDFSLFI